MRSVKETSDGLEISGANGKTVLVYPPNSQTETKYIDVGNLVDEVGITSIVAGDNITVDDTDPLNPVVSATVSGGGGTQVDIITTTNASHPVPEGAKGVHIQAWGGGGGGGSGRCDVAGSGRSGGGGGAAGSYVETYVVLFQPPETCAVTIGAGGAGGAGVTSPTNGITGSSAGRSFVEFSGSQLFSTHGSNSGVGGNNVQGNGGTAPNSNFNSPIVTASLGVGGNANTTTGTASSNSTTPVSGGGGAGGGLDSGNTERAGRDGASVRGLGTGSPTMFAGGTAGVVNGARNGGNGTGPLLYGMYLGASGGGGGASESDGVTNGGNGGNGGFPGGGGGGGGAAAAGATSGAGGSGGNGLVILTWSL
jgi:hypothetical protein